MSQSSVFSRQSSVVGLRSSIVAMTKYTFVIAAILAALWAMQVMSSAWLRVHGDRLRLDGQRSRAETFYKAAIAIDPQNWSADLGLGQVYSHYRYQELDPVKKAEWAVLERDIFACAYRNNTKKEEIMYGLGRAELAIGNREAGIEMLRRAANYKRFNDFYWRKLGIELRKEGHYEEAFEVFLHARKLQGYKETVKHNLLWLRDELNMKHSLYWESIRSPSFFDPAVFWGSRGDETETEE